MEIVHDPEYRRSLKDWNSFVETLTDKIIEADETVPELPIKDVVFRIYRDIRFSKDPTPYKVRDFPCPTSESLKSEFLTNSSSAASLFSCLVSSLKLSQLFSIC